jgi:hypothetical protein
MGSAGTGGARQQQRLLGAGGYDSCGGRLPGAGLGGMRASPALPPESPDLLPMARGGVRGSGMFEDALGMDDRGVKHQGRGGGGGALLGSGAGAALNTLLGQGGGAAARRGGGGGGGGGGMGMMAPGSALGRGGPAVRACVMSECEGRGGFGRALAALSAIGPPLAWRACSCHEPQPLTPAAAATPRLPPPQCPRA